MSRLAIEARGLSKAYKIGKLRQQVLKDVEGDRIVKIEEPSAQATTK